MKTKLIIVISSFFLWISCKKDNHKSIDNKFDKIAFIDIYPADTVFSASSEIQQMEFLYNEEGQPDTINYYIYQYENEASKKLFKQIFIQYLSPNKFKLTPKYYDYEEPFIRQTIELNNGKIIQNEYVSKDLTFPIFNTTLTEYQYASDGKLKQILSYADGINKKNAFSGFKNFTFNGSELVSYSTFPKDTLPDDYSSDIEYSILINYADNSSEKGSVNSISNNYILAFLYDNAQYGFSNLSFLGNQSDKLIQSLSMYKNGVEISTSPVEYTFDDKLRVVSQKIYLSEGVNTPILTTYMKFRYLN